MTYCVGLNNKTFQLENKEENKMDYQAQIKKAVQEFYDVTKAFASSRHYTLSYWWVESNFGLDLSDEKVRADVHEMSYSNGFCDLIQAVDFDNDKKEVLIMLWESNNKKKYTIDQYDEFCNNALVMPPLDEFAEGSIDEAEWYKTHKIHITVGNHDMELDYHADNVTEIDSAIKVMYEMEMDFREIKDDQEDGNAEFRTKLKEAFKTHMFMKDRDKHTVNELLHILRYDNAFKGEDFNISIQQLNGEWCTIPTLVSFVPTTYLSMWFEDAKVEFEVEECGEENFNCITIYESEGV